MLLLLLQMIYIFNLAGSWFLIQISRLPPLCYQPVYNVESVDTDQGAGLRIRILTPL